MFRPPPRGPCTCTSEGIGARPPPTDRRNSARSHRSPTDGSPRNLSRAPPMRESFTQASPADLAPEGPQSRALVVWYRGSVLPSIPLPSHDGGARLRECDVLPDRKIDRIRYLARDLTCDKHSARADGRSGNPFQLRRDLRTSLGAPSGTSSGNDGPVSFGLPIRQALRASPREDPRR